MYTRWAKYPFSCNVDMSLKAQDRLSARFSELPLSGESLPLRPVRLLRVSISEGLTQANS